MATKPTANLPEWVLATPSAREEPTAGKKIQGFIFNEPYGEKTANWLWYSASVWLAWAEEAIDEIVATVGYLTKGDQSVNSTGDLAGLEDVLLLIDSSGGAFTLNLPDPTTIPGAKYFLKDVGGALSTNPVTMNRFGAENFEGLAADYDLQSDFGFWQIYCDGTDYYII